MSNTKQFTISIILVAIFVSSLGADEPAETNDSSVEVNEVKRQPALVVYQGLLEEYHAGKSNGLPTLELLRTWSLRVSQEPSENLQTGFPPPEDAVAELRETIIKTMESHSERMNELGKIVRASFTAGKAEYIEVAAVEYYIAEAERLPQTFETLQRVLYQASEVEVTLPEVDVRTPLPSAKKIMVDVDTKGQIKLQGESLTLEQFEKLLQNEKSDHGELSVYLRCDPRLKHRDVAAITDIARKFAERLAIEVLEEPGNEKDE